MQSLARRLENGGALSCAGVCASAQPFLAALLRRIFQDRPVIAVTDSLKTQEGFQQDLETWLSEMRIADCGLRNENAAPSSILNSPSSPLFYPAWDVLPHEGRLPHADILSDRLETLVALTDVPEGGALRGPDLLRNGQGLAELAPPRSPLVVTSVAALLQRTFPPASLREHTRVLRRGDRVDPLALVEWLEGQGYDPEAQVTQKGETALRGGILDVWPLISPWPARLEFFGDELESLRQFDPLTQISRDEIASVTLPPGGELGILKKMRNAECGMRNENTSPGLSILLDYLPPEAIVLLCEPEQLAARASEYARQIPENDPFFISWTDFLIELSRRGFASVEVEEETQIRTGWGERPREPNDNQMFAVARGDARPTGPNFTSLDAFRPLGERAPDPQVAGAQRREFFNQLHRWLRQDFAVHVFCNNDGERQRFGEILGELGLEQESVVSSQWSVARAPEQTDGATANQLQTAGYRLLTHIGTLSRGFLCNDAKFVVVTDAEIFGRYKIQRPRRLKSPHAQAARPALEIDFTELEEGDLVVHLQYGIGKFLGLKNLPTTTGPSKSEIRNQKSEMECLVIEYAPASPGDEPPKLYVPVTEAHLVGKYIGAGRAHPPLNTLGGTRWQKAKAQAERAVRDVAAELLAIQAARESQPGHAFAPDTPWQREFESAFIYEETPDQSRSIGETKADMERAKPMDRLICGDAGYGKTEVAIRAAFKAVLDGRQVAVLGAHDRAGPAALQHVPRAHGGLSRPHRTAFPLPHAPPAAVRGQGPRRRIGGHRHRHAPAYTERHCVQGTRPGGD